MGNQITHLIVVTQLHHLVHNPQLSQNWQGRQNVRNKSLAVYYLKFSNYYWFLAADDLLNQKNVSASSKPPPVPSESLDNGSSSDYAHFNNKLTIAEFDLLKVIWNGNDVAIRVTKFMRFCTHFNRSWAEEPSARLCWWRRRTTKQALCMQWKPYRRLLW